MQEVKREYIVYATSYPCGMAPFCCPHVSAATGADGERKRKLCENSAKASIKAAPEKDKTHCLWLKACGGAEIGSASQPNGACGAEPLEASRQKRATNKKSQQKKSRIFAVNTPTNARIDSTECRKFDEIFVHNCQCYLKSMW